MRWNPAHKFLAEVGFSILPEYCYECNQGNWLVKGWRIRNSDNREWVCNICAPELIDAQLVASTLPPWYS